MGWGTYGLSRRTGGSQFSDGEGGGGYEESEAGRSRCVCCCVCLSYGDGGGGGRGGGPLAGCWAAEGFGGGGGGFEGVHLDEEEWGLGFVEAMGWMDWCEKDDMIRRWVW